jgi:hypothetical protein
MRACLVSFSRLQLIFPHSGHTHTHTQHTQLQTLTEMHADAAHELLDRVECELGLSNSRGIVDKDAEARRRDEV